MEFKNRIFSTPLLLLLIFLFACDKADDQPETPSFSVSVSEIRETGFTVSWSATEPLNSVVIEVSKEIDMATIVYAYSEDQPGISSHSIDNLEGATNYYFRLKANFGDGSSFTTKSQAQQTSFTSETVTINTPDGMELSGKLSYLSYIQEPRPAIIFMHELGVFVNNWKAADVVKRLVAEGYVCLVFDFRGHGNSTSIPDLGMLISDWNLVATDLKSAMAFLKSNSHVDSTQLALTGGSLGAAMALAGNGYEEVRSSVALSPPKMGMYQIFPELILKNVCFIVGEYDIHTDPNVNFPEMATDLYGITQDPRSLTIIPSTGAHGTNLLESPGVEDLVFDWIKAGFGE